MQLTRTTIRLTPPIKAAAQTKAIEMNVSFQELVNTALKAFLNREATTRAKKIIFKTQDIGVPLDHLTREDIYAD